MRQKLLPKARKSNDALLCELRMQKSRLAKWEPHLIDLLDRVEKELSRR